MSCCLEALPACISNAYEIVQIDNLCGERQRLFMRKVKLVLILACCLCYCVTYLCCTVVFLTLSTGRRLNVENVASAHFFT